MTHRDESTHDKHARPRPEESAVPQVAEPAPQPTVFGAATAAGAVAASAMAGRGRAEEDVREDDTVAEGDGAVETTPPGRNRPAADRPLEESPQVQAAVEDETTVPQLMREEALRREELEGGSGFREPGDLAGDFPATEDVIGAAMGGGTPGADKARTGSEQPWDPEDVAAAHGQHPTPGNIDRARRELDEQGAAAIEKTVP